MRHKLLLFRGQSLSPRQQRDFAANFGPLHTHPLIENVSEQPEIMVLDFGPDRRFEDSDWHTDVTFIETPPPLTQHTHGQAGADGECNQPPERRNADQDRAGGSRKAT